MISLTDGRAHSSFKLGCRVDFHAFLVDSYLLIKNRKDLLNFGELGPTRVNIDYHDNILLLSSVTLILGNRFLM